MFTKARSFLLQRPSLALAPLWLLLGGAIGLAFDTSSTRIWPSPIRVIPFADREHAGRSSSRLDTINGRLDITWRLDSGAQYPIAGAILFLGGDTDVVDMSGRGVVRMEVGASDIPAVKVCLVEDLPGFTRSDAWQTARYECADIEMLPGTPVYDIPFERFVTPQWWNVASGLRTSQIGPEKRSRIVRIILQTAEGSPIGQTFHLRLQNLSVHRERPWFLLASLGIGLLLSSIQILASIRSQSTLPIGGAPSQRVPVQFQPIEARSYSDREREAVIECIGREYTDPELSLEKVSRSTGVPLDRVTSHVKTASGLLFKAYLNRVRGEAAHKLLLETDLPVSEIAMKVGYGSPPHFNRVFRELYGTTPTALREGGTTASPAETTEEV